ncbi:MAG: SpoIID/LytB domain-containing protein [Clostridia bacterium]|nr:SpoIID/LytB domain-containing protein [Clostridia bacterium]
MGRPVILQKVQLITGFLVLMLLLTSVNWFQARAAETLNIRVGLALNAAKAGFGVEGSYILVDGGSNREITIINPGETWEATVLGDTALYVKGPDGQVFPLPMGGLYALGGSGQTIPLGNNYALTNESGVVSNRSGIQLSRNGQIIGAFNGPILVKEVSHQGSNLVNINGTRYRGELEMRKTGNALTLINKLPIEEYLYGVVPREMPSSWPVEALKAQAVAARTYVIQQKGRYESQGFDVMATDQSQVYGGLSGEKPSTNAAVDATRGEIVTYNGQPITAVYHSSSGGYTENSEEVWTNPVPYLRSKVDLLDVNSAHYNWQKVFTAEELKNQINLARNLDFATITDLAIEKMSASGARVQILQVVGTDIKGQPKTLRLLNADNVRSAFGLKSAPQTVVEEVDSMKNLVKITFTGNGWGHGLGMSQYGASGMARAGNNYRQILEHYYTGITIASNYNQ